MSAIIRFALLILTLANLSHPAFAKSDNADYIADDGKVWLKMNTESYTYAHAQEICQGESERSREKWRLPTEREITEFLKKYIENEPQNRRMEKAMQYGLIPHGGVWATGDSSAHPINQKSTAHVLLLGSGVSQVCDLTSPSQDPLCKEKHQAFCTSSEYVKFDVDRTKVKAIRKNVGRWHCPKPDDLDVSMKEVFGYKSGYSEKVWSELFTITGYLESDNGYLIPLRSNSSRYFAIDSDKNGHTLVKLNPNEIVCEYLTVGPSYHRTHINLTYSNPVYMQAETQNAWKNCAFEPQNKTSHAEANSFIGASTVCEELPNSQNSCWVECKSR